MRRLACLLALCAACGKKPAPAREVVAYERRVAERDDCVHHAAAVVPVDRAALVIGACGRTGEGSTGEEILAVRVDERGVAGDSEPVTLLENGWATNVVAARVSGGGGVMVGWTAAIDRRARAFVLPVDVQGRATGEAIELGRGRAAAAASGPSGVGVLLVSEPDELSDDDPGARREVSLVVVDSSGEVVGNYPVSRRVDGVSAVSLAGRPDAYGVVWSESGMLWGELSDQAGKTGRASPVAPALTSVGLDEAARLAWPALALRTSRAGKASALVAAIVEGGSHAGEIWVGEGELGLAETGWSWRRVAQAGSGPRARLAASLDASDTLQLAFTEVRPGAELPVLVRVAVPSGKAGEPPFDASTGAVVFDGVVAIASENGATITVAAEPPTKEKNLSALTVTQR